MRYTPTHRFVSLVAPLCLLVVAGCVDSGALSDNGSGEARAGSIGEYASEHYVVRVVDGGQRSTEIARHGALMMEEMFNIYSGLDDVPLPPGDPMPFWLHFNRRFYDKQAALYGFPANATNGFCTTSGEVHVYYKKNGSLPPEATAMHEGFHQYCHRALHFPTPHEVFERVPNYNVAKLPTVPLWLAEGMAMNMESGKIQTDHNGVAISVDKVGSVNLERLEHLVELINTKRCPSVRATMNLIMGDMISTDDYAVMWGIVFDFRMVTGNAIYLREEEEMRRAGPQAVRAAIDAAIDPHRPYPSMRWPVPVPGRFMRACRVVWGLDVPTLVDTCATGARAPRDFDRQWNRRLTQAALAEVERLLRDNGESLEEWEVNWRKRMITLYAQVRKGGYEYVEPKGIQDAAGFNRFPGISPGEDVGGRAGRSGGGASGRAIGAW